MSKTNPNDKKPIPQNYELFILALSIISIVNIVIEILPINSESKSAIVLINLLLSIIFFGDFLYRLHNSKSKRFYFFKDLGWLDLLGSIPFGPARIFRLFRVFRAIRTIRKFGLRNMIEEFAGNKAQGALLFAIVCIIIVLEFGSAFIVAFESKDSNANIKTGGDALWWAYVTITTVGYGDRYPVTPQGRIIGLIVLTTGVGLFGVFTGYLANTFLAPRKKKTHPQNLNIKDRLELIKKQIEEIENHLD